MNKNLVIFSSVIFFLLSASLSSALTIYVQPGNQGVSRLAVSPFQTATEKRSFVIKNLNNFSATVDMELSGNITNIIEIEKSFSLDVNESRTVNYTIKVSQPGIYQGGILIAFNTPQGHATYESTLMVIASKGKLDYKLFIIPAIALVAVAAVLILSFRGRWKITVKKKVRE